jgi:hypothetical protein
MPDLPIWGDDTGDLDPDWHSIEFGLGSVKVISALAGAFPHGVARNGEGTADLAINGTRFRPIAGQWVGSIDW